MNIKYDNLLIREATQNDAVYYQKHWKNYGTDYTLEKVISLITQKGNKAEVLEHIIELDGKIIGNIYYSADDADSAEISLYITDENQKNKGYGTLILNIMIDNLFNYGYKKIILHTSINNKVAQYVAENKFGLTSTIKENFAYYYLLKEDWQSKINYEVL